MKKILYPVFILLSFISNAQVKVGDNPTTINGSSLLELESSSSNKGLLLPRINLTNTTTWGLATNTPINGMIIYNTNTSITSTSTSYPVIAGGIGVYYWDGAGWVGTNLSSSSGMFWSLTGNTGTIDGTNFLGTADNVPLTFRVNNIQAARIDNTNANTFFGYQAGINNTASNNQFIGYQAGYNNTTGTPNFFAGYQAGYNNTTGYQNTAVGNSSLFTNTTGYFNVAVGLGALYSNTTGVDNTATGFIALYSNTTGIKNTATGMQALFSNTTGNWNVAEGYEAVYTNSTGSSLTGLGWQALYYNTTGSNNTAVGYQSLYYNTIGASNVGVGYFAIQKNTTGNNNTAIGYAAGKTNTTGNNNTFFGYAADAATNNLTNASAIGYSAVVSQSNSVVLGGTGANAVSVGIGVSAPNSTLQVAGSVSTNIVTVTGSYTLTSSDYTVIFTGSSAVPTFTLPDPTTCKGRMYRLINASTPGNYQDVSLSFPVYYISGQSSSVLSINTFTVSNGLADPTVGNTTIIQSDGNVWWRVGL